MRHRLVAFDLDGTLVDSRAAILGCFRHAQREHGLDPVDDAEIAARIGLPLGQMLAGLVAPAAVERCLESYSAAFPEWDRAHTVPFDGVMDVVEALRTAGAQVVITSSKSRRGITRVVRERGLESLFDAWWGGDDVQNGKPHPEMLEAAMAQMGVGPEATVIVGDTTYDIEMGVAAGARAVGVGWGMHGLERLEAAGAHALVEAVADLEAAVVG